MVEEVDGARGDNSARSAIFSGAHRWQTMIKAAWGFVNSYSDGHGGVSDTGDVGGTDMAPQFQDQWRSNHWFNNALTSF